MTIIEKYFYKNTPEKKVYEFIANILYIKDSESKTEVILDNKKKTNLCKN
tara:strand:- start:265 stop:414 length:150 start_codon:yes stop_codon:yes gene_type:complete